MYFVKRALVIFLFIVVTDFLHSQNMIETDDIVYKTVKGGELMLDIAKSDQTGSPKPAIVFLCGNSWGFDKSINRAQFSFALDQAVSKGYVGVSVDYSSVKENFYKRPLGIFPSQLYDVKSAIRFLRNHAKEYDIDPGRIGVLGFSSGANLALMLAFTQPVDGLEGEDESKGSSSVQAVVNFAAVTDLVSWNLEPYAGAYIGKPLSVDPDSFKKASPINYIHSGTPPVLTIHGDKDHSVPVEQAYLLDEKMKEANAPHILIIKKNMGHAIFDLDDTIWDFLDNTLKAKSTK